MRDEMLSESEMTFARLIWDNEPIRSGKLVRLCNEKLGWKKSTTYTVLRNLCDAGIFQNQDAIVSSLVTKEQYMSRESTKIVENRFEGSLSKFITAFADRTKLTKDQIAELKKFIDEYDEN